MSSSTYVPPKAKAWLLAHPTARICEATAALGITTGTVRTYRYRLIALGMLARHGMDAKLRAVCDEIKEGRKVREIAVCLGISPTAVSWRLARMDTCMLDARRDLVYSGRELAAMFGYAPDSAGSYRWLARLQAAGLTPRHPGARRHWRVTAEQLMAFLESPASWSLIKLARMRDADWQTYAEQARAGAYAVPKPTRGQPRTTKEAPRDYLATVR